MGLKKHLAIQAGVVRGFLGSMIVPTCALAAIISLSLPNGVSAVDTPSVQCGKGAEHCSTEGNNWVQKKTVLSGVGTHSMVEGAEKNWPGRRGDSRAFGARRTKSRAVAGC